MKVITVTIVMGASQFTNTCTSASEAFDVVRDAWAGTKGVAMDPSVADDWMECLLRMMKGISISREQGAIRVRVVDIDDLKGESA